MASSIKNLSDFSHIQVADASPFKFAIVVAQWNAEITGALLNGAITGLEKHGAQEKNIQVIEVPGSFELISGADLVFRNQNFDAVICLGCVIQGETRHFDFICDAVANGIANVGLKYNKPATVVVLTTHRHQQALQRTVGNNSNKDEQAAITAIQTAHIAKKF